MTKEDIVISQVHTVCKKCVFSDFDIKDGKRIQKGCKLNKIKQYEKAGVEILNVFDEDGNEFNVVNNRFCMFHRTEHLMEAYPKDSWEDTVKRQTKVPYQMIIFINIDTTTKQIRDSVRYIKAQMTQPNFVTFVNFQCMAYEKEPEKYIKPLDILEILQDSEFQKFSLKNIYDGQVDYRTAIDFVMDSTIKYPYPFYTCFESGFKIPETFSEELNEAVFIKMKQIGFAYPIDEINGMIVNKIAHKKHGGNSFLVNLETKIKKFENNADTFLHEAADICPSLKLKK